MAFLSVGLGSVATASASVGAPVGAPPPQCNPNARTSYDQGYRDGQRDGSDAIGGQGNSRCEHDSGPHGKGGSELDDAFDHLASVMGRSGGHGGGHNHGGDVEHGPSYNPPGGGPSYNPPSSSPPPPAQAYAAPGLINVGANVGPIGAQVSLL